MSGRAAPTGDDVSRFIDTIEEPPRRTDSEELIRMMRRATGEEPTMPPFRPGPTV
jgi:hypothetical protein